MQRLIKPSAFLKHISHSDDGRSIPWVQWLVKEGAFRKHMFHVGNRQGIPGFNVTMSAIVFFTIVSYGLFQLLVATRLITCSHVMFVCTKCVFVCF